MSTVADILKTHIPFHYIDQAGKVFTAGTYCGAIYLDGMLTTLAKAEVVGQASMSFGTRFLLETGALLDCDIREPPM